MACIRLYIAVCSSILLYMALDDCILLYMPVYSCIAAAAAAAAAAQHDNTPNFRETCAFRPQVKMTENAPYSLHARTVPLGGRFGRGGFHQTGR